jgi:hypothetical protein
VGSAPALHVASREFLIATPTSRLTGHFEGGSGAQRFAARDPAESFIVRRVQDKLARREYIWKAKSARCSKRELVGSGARVFTRTRAYFYSG